MPVAQINEFLRADRCEQVTRLLRLQDRRLPPVHDVLRTTHGRRGVECHPVADDQVVAEHPFGSEVASHS